MNRKKIFSTFASLLLSCCPSLVCAENISLLQETKEISCENLDGSSEIKSLWIDKKDYLLKLTTKSGAEETFEQIKFFDRGILAKSQNVQKRTLFFQVLENGRTLLHIGDLIAFKEGDCEDTGASKTCKSEALGTFLWTPEKLSLKKSKLNLKLEISRYGFFPNKATFTYAQASKKTKLGYPSLLLIDSGAQVDLLVGNSSLLSCAYQEMQKP